VIAGTVSTPAGTSGGQQAARLEGNVIHIPGQSQPIIGGHHEFKFMARSFQNP